MNEFYDLDSLLKKMQIESTLIESGWEVKTNMHLLINSIVLLVKEIKKLKEKIDDNATNSKNLRS